MYIVGHRGAKGLAPENTVASMQKAIEHHVDEIETDCRVTRDGIIVQFHDKSTLRLTGVHMPVAAHTYDELKSIKPDIATLDDVVRAVDHRVPMRIEVKPGVPVQPVIDAVRGYLDSGWQPADFLLASFSQKTLRALHAAFPEIDMVVIERFSAIRAVYRARQVGTSWLVMNHHFIWFGLVRLMTHAGFKLTPYTMNNPAKALRWHRHGLYGVVTDYPDRFMGEASAKTDTK